MLFRSLKPIKDVQEGYGVGTPGDTHENPVARLEHFFVGNGICNSGYQGMGLAIVFVFRHRNNPGAAGGTLSFMSLSSFQVSSLAANQKEVNFNTKFYYTLKQTA